MAGLKADCVNKKHHPDYVDMLRQIQTVIQGAKEHPDEKHGGNTQPEAEETYVADEIAEPDNGKKQQQRILCQ